MKCTKELFSKEGLKTNISSYILAFIIFFFLLSILLFLKCGYPLLEDKIKNIINMVSRTQKHSKTLKISNTKTKKKIKKQNKLKGNKNPPKKINLNIINNLNINKNKKKKKNNNSIRNFQNLATYIVNNNYNKTNRNKGNKKKKLNLNLMKDNARIEFNIFELNSLSYKNAILHDKRTCLNYYISLLTIKHPILFSFCPINDYNSIIIKLCITGLSFSIYYAINFAFFNDKTIHKIYTDKGKYDFIYFIPKISISFVCSYIISLIIKYIFLSERNLLQIRRQNNVAYAELKASKEKKNLIIKYILSKNFVFQ